MDNSQQQKNIHHFPGHMKKTMNTLPSFIKSADLIVEILDARAPLSTRNPMLLNLVQGKPHLIVLSKEDRSDSKETKAWVEYFEKKGTPAFSSNLKKGKILDLFVKASAPLVNKKREKEKRIGMKKQPIRLLVVGIPNVGKSTLINNLAGKNVVKAANRPGVTRAEQWIKVSNDFVLLDTPGVLPMNYEERTTAVRLALLGSIKTEVLPIDELTSELLVFLRTNYPTSLCERYKINDLHETEDLAVLDVIGKSRGFLLQGGETDITKSSLALLKDFQEGNLGNYSLEKAE